jgi:hypothetical protein
MSQLFARKQVFIEASPEIVWNVHTDIDAWVQWQRSISSARALAPLAVGSSFEWKSGGLTIVSTIQTLELNRSISWTGVAIGTQANHTWTLQAKNGGTLVITEESMNGWLVSLLKLFTPLFLEKSLETWLHDLQKRAEEINKGRIGLG